ncbi:MAG: YbaB/EbfC family nucleoid-associated protein [Pirellulaceae bacterium]
MFKGLGGLGNIASLMRNAHGITDKLEEVSEELKLKRAIGSAGGGMVTVEVNGHGQVLKVTIDENLVQSNELEMIQDLLPAAINEASSKAKQMHVEAMKDVTGGLSLPGLDDMIERYTSHGESGPDDSSGPSAQ